MDPAEYDLMDAHEARMWWYRALHRNLIGLARRWLPADARVLDAGCGTGGFLGRLDRALPRRRLVGVDIEVRAVAAARRKSPVRVAVASLDSLPFGDGAFDAMFSADVLCHRAVDERRALAEFRRCLKSGGILFLNLPAYGWLRSAHDRQVGTVRRYTRSGLRDLLTAEGFKVVRATYWNTLLFPLMVLHRLVLSRDARESDVKFYPAAVEALFTAATRIEHLLLRLGVVLPFGGSVMAVAMRHG